MPSEGPGGAPLRRVEWGAGIALTLLALWVYAARLMFAGGLWRDEVAALHLATLPSLAEVYRLFPHEAFPLAVPLSLRLWTALCGESDLALRLFGLAVGVAIVAALWASARTTARTPPLVGLALLACNAAFVVFTSEVRGYGLGSLFIVASFAALARLVARPGRWAAVAAAVALLGAVHCLLANAALVAALCSAAALAAGWRGGWRPALRILGLGALAAVSLLPYAAPLAAARAWDVVVKYPMPVRHLLTVLAATFGPGAARLVWLAAAVAGLAAAAPLARRALRSARRVLRSARRPVAARAAAAEWSADAPATAAAEWAAAAPAATPAASPAGAVAPAAAGARTVPGELAVPGAPSEAEAMRLFAALVVLGAVAAEMVFLWVLGYTPRAWYYLPLLALLGAALEPLCAGACRGSAARLLRLGYCVVAVAVLLPAARSRLTMRMTNVDLLTARLAELRAADDLVVVCPWYLAISFTRYAPPAWLALRGAPGGLPGPPGSPRAAGFPGPPEVPSGPGAPAPWVSLPDLADHRVHRYDLLMARLAAPHPIDDVLDRVGATLRAGHHVWLLGEVRLPAPGVPPPVLPPAPGSPAGWHDYPYTQAWLLQLGGYLEAHATSLRRVPVAAPTAVSQLEDGSLVDAAGWH